MLAVISWWLIVQALGLAALPLTWRLFARFSGRGYPFAKAFGLLLVAYVLWIGAIFHIVPNDLGGILASLVIVAGISWTIGRAGWQRDAAGGRPLLAWLRANRGLVIAAEALFAAVLIGWSAFRAYNPDIAGTEKPMEFAFINGVLNSRFFPPQDPWLSGYAISYYYFGYVMLGLFIRLSGVDPAVGFNMGVALWYALVMLGAFGVAQMLVAAARDSGRPAAGRNSIGWGMLAALCVGLLGNLEGLLDTAYQRGLLPLSLIQWFDIKGLTDAAPTGGWTGGFWWWWRASRVIHDKDLIGNSVELIDEFPAFSFILGDLHPHVLALPFALLAVGLAANLLCWKPEAGSWKLEAGGWKLATLRGWQALGEATGLGAPGVALYALALGALGFLNTWDFPIYVGLATLALGAALALREGLSPAVLGRALLGGIVLAALGWLLYLPFYIGFQSQLGGLRPNLLFPSRFSQFFLMFGPFLVAAGGFLLALTLGALPRRPRPAGAARTFLAALPWPLLLPPLLLALLMLGMVIRAALPGGASYLQEILGQPGVAEHAGDGTVGALAGLVVRLRLATPWTWLVLAVLIAWAAGLAWALLRGAPGVDAADPSPDRPEPQSQDAGSAGAPRGDLFVLFMILAAVGLAYIPEFIYLRDLFGSRMNTVFKFYYQAWALLGVSAAYGLSRLAERGTRAALRIPALGLAGLLLLGGLWYPLAAIPSKADSFRAAPTLDGSNYLRLYKPADMAAIEWLRANVAPDAERRVV